jgi:uncharacterized RDD family membrane protein YckC
MKCKRCLAHVPDDSDTCPNCGQDLSSLRQLLNDFYGEEEKSQEDQQIQPSWDKPVPPTTLQEHPPKKVDLLQDTDAEQPDMGPIISLSNDLSAEEPTEEEEPVEEEEEEEGMEELGSRGGFWLRFLAFAIDYILLVIILGIFGVAGLLAFKLGIGGKEEVSILLQARILIFVLLPFGFALSVVYFTFFHGTWGQTVGKMIFGLRVVQTNGRPLTFSRSLGRALAYILSAVPVFIGFFWVGFSAEKRSWHDVIADTMVLRDR